MNFFTNYEEMAAMILFRPEVGERLFPEKKRKDGEQDHA